MGVSESAVCAEVAISTRGPLQSSSKVPTSERSRSESKRDKAIIKLIGIEEHFVTADIRAAWAASALGEEGTGAFDREEIGERLDDYFKQNLYVTPSGMWSQSYLQRTLEVVGPQRILFSTDYP